MYCACSRPLCTVCLPLQFLGPTDNARVPRECGTSSSAPTPQSRFTAYTAHLYGAVHTNTAGTKSRRAALWLQAAEEATHTASFDSCGSGEALREIEGRDRGTFDVTARGLICPGPLFQSAALPEEA